MTEPEFSQTLLAPDIEQKIASLFSAIFLTKTKRKLAERKEMHSLPPPWLHQPYQYLLPRIMIVLFDRPSLKNLSGRSM